MRPPGAFSMRGHSIGGYGSVTTNKIIASLIEDIFGLWVQAYPKYGSDKKGLPTTYYMTAAQERILEHSELEHVNFVAVNDINAFAHSAPLEGLVPGGSIFVHCVRTQPEEVWAKIPEAVRQAILEQRYRFYYLDTAKIARAVASRPDLQVRMQGVVLLGVFLRIAPFVQHSDFSEAQLFEGVERALRKYFGQRGERVIQDNLTAVKRGYSEVRAIELDALFDNKLSARG